MRLSVAQLQALLEGLDWRRVHEPRRTVVPAAASCVKNLGLALSKSSQVIGGYDSIGFMMSAVEALPDDPDRLKAMLLAERAESERLRQIIKELQRYRFGRRAESLPEEQLQLGLEEAEQVEAAGQAETEGAASAERKTRTARRRANRGALPAHPGLKRWSTWRA
jgi:hypothetical protein